MTATPLTPGAAVPTAAGVPAVPVLNLPNVLTMARLAVVPVLALLLLLGGTSDGVRLLAWALFTAACITDVVDGRLARKRGQVTSFGVLVDPIADKALVGTALVSLSLLGELPWLATAVILGRELGVTLMRLAVLRHGLLPANRGGKAKALLQNIAVAAYVLPLPGVLATVRGPVLLLAAAVTVLTGLDYAAQGLRLTRAARTAQRTRPTA